MIQLCKYVTNKYDINFKLKLDYQSMLEMSRDTRGNRYKLVPKLCKCELKIQFFVNRVVLLWNVLPDKVVSFVLTHTWKCFGVTVICIIITKLSCSTGSHSVIIVLVKFLL